MVISFKALRNLKDSLPDGSIKKIAHNLSLDEDTVRNYFGGTHYKNEAKTVDFHIEKTHNGAVVKLEENEIYDEAMKILNQN